MTNPSSSCHVNMKNFTLIKEAFNEYHNGTVALYTHSSGAKVVHMKNNDPDAAFAFSFNTPSLSDDGCAHVLEHCVLQGSEKFPVSETYSKTFKGGLYTELSAGTYRFGHTDYYTGSFNEKSLYNALDVYADALFRPCLTENTFVLHANTVYNEMTAAEVSDTYILWRAALEALFPDLPCRFFSGGFTYAMPMLTYKRLKAYFHTFYTPKNCVAALYGAVDPTRFFEILDMYFSEYEYIRHEIAVPPHCPLTRGKPAGHYIVMAFAPEPDIYFDDFASLLACGQASPLYAALTEKELCDEVSASYEHLPGASACFLLSILNPKTSVEELRAIVDGVLRETASTGFDRERLDGAFNLEEIGLYEKDYGTGTSLGINAVRRCCLLLNMGEDIFTLLDNSFMLTEKKKKVFDEKIYEKLAGRLCEMSPVCIELPAGDGDGTSATAADIFGLHEDIADKQEDLEKIPRIWLKDTENKNIPLKPDVRGRFITAAIDIGELCFINFDFDVSGLPREFWKPLSLFPDMVFQCGTSKFSPAELEKKQALITGELWLGSFPIEKYKKREKKLFFRVFGKFLTKNAQAALDLMREIMHEANFDDRERVHRAIAQKAAQYRVGLAENAYYYAKITASAGANPCEDYENERLGIPMYRYVSALDADANGELNELISKLIFLKENIFSRRNVMISIGASSNNLPEIEKAAEKFLKRIPEKPADFSAGHFGEGFVPGPTKTAIILPGGSAYALFAGGLEKAYYPEYDIACGVRAVFSNILWYELLIPEIRIKGAAYGAFCDLSGINGDFFISASSYRDPNPHSSMEVFGKIADFAKNYHASPEELERTKISCLSWTDVPKKAANRFHSAVWKLLAEEPADMEQVYRNEVVNTTLEQIRALAPYIEKATRNASFAVAAEEIGEVFAEYDVEDLTGFRK